MKFIYFKVTLFTIFLLGCSSVTRVDHIPKNSTSERDLIVFFDGTSNDEGSHTNIAKLHNLVTLQNRTNISATYIKGVGTGAKIIGMAMGWGIGNDVREAYLYLMENYNPKYDKVSIFGFSRGAYSSRILAALLYVAGLPEVKHLTKKDKILLVKDIYKSYKSKDSIDTRRKNIAKMLKDKWFKKLSYTPKPVYVKFLGVWETVEALGLPDLKENIDEPNKNYADQLCNIENAAHALAIDDNRARIFTPLLLSRKHLKDEKCVKGDRKIKSNIEEVWFSGAHSDVGGGYSDTDINGLSLNWMLDKMENAGLSIVPKDTKVYSDYLGKTHNPEAGLFGLIYRKRNRNIPCYTESEDTTVDFCKKDKYDIDYKNTATSLSKPINIHQSVLDRLCIKTPENYESFWFREDKYKNCISCDSNNRGYIKSSKSCRDKINIVNNRRYQYKKVTFEDNYCDYTPCFKAKNLNYSGTKSCNYFHKNITQRAKERLEKIYMSGVGQSKTITVYADVKNDRTGIYLLKGKSYSFTIDHVENWIDCTIVNCNPEQGRVMFDSSQTYLNNIINLIGKAISYAPLSGYMELLGEVEGQQFKLGKLSKTKELFSPKKDGELILRVNEPRFSKSVYMNNYGVLKLTIYTK